VIRRGLILLVVAGVAIGIGTAFAATLTVGSNHLWAGTQTLTKGTCTLTGTTQSTDTYVDEQHTGTSYGTGTTFITEPDSGKRKYAYVRFDLSSCGLPTTGGADSATLSVRITTAPTASRTLTVTPVTSTWSNTTTWSAAPTAAAASTTTFTTGTTNNVTKTVTVTVDADDFIKGNLTNWGWRIADLGSTATAYQTTFASSNATTNKPTLTINYEQ
jgi:hypothetical protein